MSSFENYLSDKIGEINEFEGQTKIKSKSNFQNFKRKHPFYFKQDFPLF